VSRLNMSAPVISLEEVGVNQGHRWLFQGLNVTVGARDRLALVGRNGVGKSTLMRLLAGELEIDAGKRAIRPDLTVVFLEQEPVMTGFATLSAYAHHTRADGLAPLAHDVEAIADQFGVRLNIAAHSASGGERRRAAIVRALAFNPDVLLLDEPTNHLDITAIGLLESWLQAFSGAFLCISHDRRFLSSLTRSTLWLERGLLRRKEIGFGGFEEWQEQAYAEEERAAQKLDSRLALEMHWLHRGVTARRRRNQGRLRKLEDMRAARRTMLQPRNNAKLGASKDDIQAKIMVDMEGVSKNFGDRVMLKNFTFRLLRGDRVGIVGPNGAGKTTLLNLLTGALEPDSGSIKRAKGMVLTLVDQKRDLLQPGKTLREVLADGGDWIEVRGVRKHVHGYLKDFLFSPDLADAKVETLSGGEQSRLLLARALAKPTSLLVLDEPTNDLDLDTLELLEETISDFEGTVIIVSHDRDFLDKTVAVTIGLDGTGRADIVVGGYRELEAQAKPQRLPKSNSSRQEAKTSLPALPASTPKAPAAPAPAATRTKLNFKEQRELELLPQEIAKIEAEIKKLEDRLGDSTIFVRDPQAATRFAQALEDWRQVLQHKEERWLELEALAQASA
jgi:ABC transport system ATP-binding/permease protein